MSRTRSISPDFWTCEAVVDCTAMARLLFLGLHSFADDFGVQPLRPRTIRMQVFPGDAVDGETARALIEELASHGLVRLHSVAGQDYIAIVDWQRTQRVGKRTRRRYPDISEVHQGLTPDAPAAKTIETHSNPPDARSPCFETAALRPPQHEVRLGGPCETIEKRYPARGDMTRELKVFSSIAVRGVLETLVPDFERAHGVRLDIVWNTAPALVKRLQAGETADVLILNRAGMDTVTRPGRVLAGSEATLASSDTALGIKAGAPRPDISTAEALVGTLRAARTIAYTDPAAGGASGIYFAQLIERLGLAAEVNAKTTFPPPGGLVGHLLVSGAVELAVQQVPELLEVAGVEVLGTLPGDLHMVTTFVAGIGASSAEVEMAQALIDLLRSRPTAELFRAKGLDPA